MGNDKSLKKPRPPYIFRVDRVIYIIIHQVGGHGNTVFSTVGKKNKKKFFLSLFISKNQNSGAFS
jgi:hypothetical protein